MSTSMTQVSGTLLSASPPQMRPRLIDGRSKRAELCRANGSDSMPLNTSTALTTALSPSHGVAPCAERPRTCRRTASTPFAWTPTWRLVGSPVIAKSPMKPCSTRASEPRFSSSSDSSSETIPKPHPHGLLLAQVVQQQHHHRQRALHVVGAAAVEAVALQARAEHLIGARDHVDVAVQDEGRRIGGADLGHRHRQAAGGDLLGVDVARLEPAADELRGTAEPLRGGGVERDQALGQGDFVHQGIVGTALKER